jgi:uncharacterized RDD family membrane protein YckC
MSANSSTLSRGDVSRSGERIVEFSPEAMKAPFLLRLGAAFIDYIVIVLFPVLGLFIASLSGDDGSRLINSELNNIGWLVGIFVAIVDLIIFPAAIGRSIGKMATGLRIVAIDGSEPSFGSVILRNTLGYLLTFASFGIGLIFSLFSSKGRALHDYIGGTVLIRGRRKFLK